MASHLRQASTKRAGREVEEPSQGRDVGDAAADVPAAKRRAVGTLTSTSRRMGPATPPAAAPSALSRGPTMSTGRRLELDGHAVGKAGPASAFAAAHTTSIASAAPALGVNHLDADHLDSPRQVPSHQASRYPTVKDEPPTVKIEQAAQMQAAATAREEPVETGHMLQPALMYAHGMAMKLEATQEAAWTVAAAAGQPGLAAEHAAAEI